ncbi:nuclear RNA export factor 2-like isoform X2 [Talpa occidentalis]|uniref:nuclear RNA export factor 2-like isoform X2 n=1 Tax=Talpa occidentalis TaxID=50954 RepID=UPI0023F875FB|nr:nuclear RNA export factor 2-like isoform X2 [Talpa occidentalis]XP_054551615.1 nuclear RNA export factor 2-like isoform X2 [Talpa occidentalis]
MSKKQQHYGLPAMKYGDKEHNASGSSLQEKKKSCSSLGDSWDRSDTSEEHSEYGAQSSIFQEKNGNAEMKNGQEDPEVKHTPDNIQQKQRSVKWHDEDSIHINMWRDKKLQGRKMEDNPQDVTPVNWFKITIPEGIKYDKTWLINLLRSHCNIHFIPVDFHYVKNRARFFVQDGSAACALKDLSNKIYDEANHKIYIVVCKSTEPYSVQNMLEPEKMEHLEVTINKRYDVSQQALDLHRLRFDPDLMIRDIDIILNRRSCMTATLKIIKKNFPELLSLNLCNNKLYQLDGLSDIVQMVPTVKRLNLSRNMLRLTWELSKMKGLNLQELWLDGNPLCDTFPDQSSYVSSVRACIPTLLRLDGKELPSLVVIDIDNPYFTKPCKKITKDSETLKNLIMNFLQQYYSIYDCGDRKGLLCAYHEESCFSLSVPFNPEDPAPRSMWLYLKDSRNMKNLRDPYLRNKLLRHTSNDIIKALCMLPQTQHDLGSFLVDLWVHTEAMLCFSVHGVFRELEEKSPFAVRGFTRNFIITPGSNSSVCIVNDELFVRDATPYETQNAFSTPLPVPTAGSVPVLLQQQQQQQEMVQAFSAQSGMNLQWSQKCLQDNEWDYLRAGQIFTVLKNQGKIPEEAFKPTP